MIQDRPAKHAQMPTTKTKQIEQNFECFSATNTHFQFDGAERSHFS